MKTLLLLFSLVSLNAFACKPCEGGMNYSFYNNSIIYIGTVSKVGVGPADIVKYNKNINNSWKEKSYSIDVDVKIEEVLRNLKSDLKLSVGKIVQTKSLHSPPCKSLVTPVVGKKYVFFPEDYGNCSSFAFEIESEKKLLEVRKLAGHKSRFD